MRMEKPRRMFFTSDAATVHRVVGVGFLSAWMMLLASSPVFTGVSKVAGDPFWRLLVCLWIVVDLAAVALCVRFCSRPIALLRSVASFVVGSAGGLFGGLLRGFGEGLPLEIAASYLMGLAFVLLCCAWSRCLGTLMLRDRIIMVAGGVVMGSILYLVSVMVPHPFSLFVGSCFPAASFFCAFALQGGATQDTAGSSHAQVALWSGWMSLGGKLTMLTFSVGMCFSLMGHVMAGFSEGWTASIAPGALCVIALLVCELAITYAMVKRARKENPRVAFRPSTMCVALAFLLVCFADGIAYVWCLALSFAGFGSFLVYLIIVVGNVSQKNQCDSLGVLALALFSIVAGAVAGELIAFVLVATGVAHGGNAAAMYCLIALFALMVAHWYATDPVLLASETREMGGHFYPDERPAEALKLKEAAAHFGLSPRESEVFAMLAKGRSVPYICDALFLSKGTVQTHVRHIYAKMGVTNGRQGLLDALEHFENR